jgi:AraC family transcriptional regulator
MAGVTVRKHPAPLQPPTLRYTIPTACREDFLRDFGVGSKALLAHRIASAAFSDLVAPYDILRTPYAFDHAVLFTLGGEGRARVDGEDWVLEPGSVLLLPASGEQHFWTEGRWSMLWFHLARCPYWDRLVPAPSLRRAMWAGELQTLGRLFLEERARARPDTAWLLESYVKSMALLLERETRTPAPTPLEARRPALEALWKAVSDHPERSWTLGACAEACACSTRTLQAAVREAYGQPLTALVTRLRMERARVLLEHTTWTLAELAARVGYENAFAFSRAFKRETGQSPQAFRDKATGR